jgi:hypothetical protein
MMLLSGTGVPPEAAEAATLLKGNAVADINKIAAQRVSVRVARVIDKRSIILTATAMTAVTPSK